MLKIHDMTTKQTLEVQDTDLLVIEDEEDTKAITVATLKEVMADGSDVRTKILINETIEKAAAALLGLKYNIAQLHQYIIYTRIDSSLGDIVVAIKDAETNKWLTVEEIYEVSLLADETASTSFTIKLLVGGFYEGAISYAMKKFTELYADNVNTELDQELYDLDAGLISAHFAGLTQNDIAEIKHDNVIITLPNNENHEFEFISNEELFVNNVPYEGVV